MIDTGLRESSVGIARLVTVMVPDFRSLFYNRDRALADLPILKSTPMLGKVARADPSALLNSPNCPDHTEGGKVGAELSRQIPSTNKHSELHVSFHGSAGKISAGDEC